jgi:hypothetical protein
MLRARHSFEELMVSTLGMNDVDKLAVNSVPDHDPGRMRDLGKQALDLSRKDDVSRGESPGFLTGMDGSVHRIPPFLRMVVRPGRREFSA